MTFSFELRRIGFWPQAANASLAAPTSLSANEQSNQLLETFGSAAGVVLLIESITSWTRRELAFQSRSTKACNTLVTGSFGWNDRTRARRAFASAYRWRSV